MHASTLLDTARASAPALLPGTAAAPAPTGPALIVQIQARLAQLSPTMRAIGGYCLRTHTWWHQMSIDEVAEHCGTVPSSVVRFARLFGHKGYHDFKLAFLARGAMPESGTPERVSSPPARLLSCLDEDVYQLSELRTLIQDDAFQMALAWIRTQPRLSLTFHGELDRMVAIHFGDALQRAGKFVLLTDQLQAAGRQPSQAGGTCIHLDLERPRLHAAGAGVAAVSGGPAGSAGYRIDLLGTDRHRGAQTAVHQLSLPVYGSTLGRRLQKALSIADTIEAALH